MMGISARRGASNLWLTFLLCLHCGHFTLHEGVCSCFPKPTAATAASLCSLPNQSGRNKLTTTLHRVYICN